jgi:hypothetical protein
MLLNTEDDNLFISRSDALEALDDNFSNSGKNIYIFKDVTCSIIFYYINL